MKKKRMDDLLVEYGLANTRDEAMRFIMAGLAIADDKRIDKPGDLIPVDAVIRLKERLPYVSRGGIKLKAAIDYFHLDMKDALVLDIGASTGGFTDVCLQHGACKVVAVDSGFCQLHNKLLHDERVVSFENSNFRYFTFDKIGEFCDYIVTDVSFISLIKIIPQTVQFCKTGTHFIALIKPQFEAERNQVDKGGIVHSKDVHCEVIKKVIDFAFSYKFCFNGLIKSPITGAKGNIEYLSFFTYNKQADNEIENIDVYINKVVFDESSDNCKA